MESSSDYMAAEAYCLGLIIGLGGDEQV